MSNRYIDKKLDQTLVPHTTIDPERFAAQMEVFARMRATIADARAAKMIPAGVTIDAVEFIVDGVPILRMATL